MQVARVRIEAPATSFRYPHFLIGQQISYDMPPPSTIYGHVASAYGQLPDPGSFRFAYDFRVEGRASDLEHQHIITAGGSRSTFSHDGSKYPISVDVTVQPHKRDFLFRPQLTLYLDNPDLAEVFRTPVFCVILGRSQDLATIVASEVVELVQRPSAYFEHTLLPFAMRQSLGVGVTVTMPRYIEPPPERRAHFDRFIVLRDRVFAGKLDHPERISKARRVLQDGEQSVWWVDPTTPEHLGAYRGVQFHGFG